MRRGHLFDNACRRGMGLINNVSFPLSLTYSSLPGSLGQMFLLSLGNGDMSDGDSQSKTPVTNWIDHFLDLLEV